MGEKMGFLKKWIKKIWYRHKLRRMDRRWRIQGGASYQLFPPSFYYAHSPEEIQGIADRELLSLTVLVQKYEEKYVYKK